MRKFPIFVIKSQLGPQFLSCLKWIIFFENLFQFVPFRQGNYVSHVS